MMKFFNFLFLNLIFLNLSYSQEIVEKYSDGYLIRFISSAQPYIEKVSGDFRVLDFFEATDESKPGFPKLPSKIFYLAIPPNGKVTIQNFQVFNTSSQNILIEANPIVDIENDSILVYHKSPLVKNFITYEIYPESEIEVLGYTWIRDFYVAAIKINTHRYSFQNKTLSILDSCLIRVNIPTNKENLTKKTEPLSIYDEILKQIILNFDDAINFRSENSRTNEVYSTDNWIDYSKEYIKLAIPSDNIYRITYQDLVSYGLNPALINPKTFKLFWKGTEQQIYVHGEEDNSFDPNDYIEFYAERNYTYQNYRQIVGFGQDYINYMNRYNDTSIVWLTWDGANGKRTRLMTENPVQTSDTVKSHLVSLHLERDVIFGYYDPVIPRVQLPFWQENKVFTWLSIGNSGSVSATFPARDFVANSQVRIIARLISYASNIVTNAHRHGLSLNRTTPQDTITYNYRQTVNLVGNYNSSQLVQGNNTIRIFGIPTQAAFHQSFVDWIDVEYFRNNVLINDTLKIIIPDTVQMAFRTIRIENVFNPSNLLIYKVKPENKQFVNFSVVGSNPSIVLFNDTVKGGDIYYITTISKISKPIFRTKKYFSNLRNPSRGADYILLSNKILQNSSTQYKNLISSSYNLRVELVFDEDIYDEFSYGLIEAEAIRNFLVTAYRNWISPKPSFLTIIGDANYDYKDIITPAPTPRKKNIVTSYGNPVSDVWYVMWDTVNIHFPQMFVGRIPANNDAQVLIYLQKHQKYLQKKYDLFNKSFLFFSGGDATKPSELAQIKAANDFVMNSYVNSPPIFGNSSHFYRTISPPSNFGPYTLEFVQKQIDEGGLFISYIGHSGTRTWDNSITEVEHLKNKYNDRFPLISDFGCSTGKFAEPDVDAFGELFICQSANGQAIAYLGNSSWGYLSTSLRFPRYFYETLTRDSIKIIGRAHTLSKIRQINETGVSDVNRVFTYCNLLMGDPIIGLQLPQKPNFVVDESKIKLITEQPNDQIDSINFKIIISNLGIVNGDSIKLLIKDSFGDSTIFIRVFHIPFTKFMDTLNFSIPVNNFIGNRTLTVQIDPDNLVDEIYENDNLAHFSYVINSTALSVIEPSENFNTARDFIEILNPFINKNLNTERVVLELSTSNDFISPRTFIKDFDTLLTKIDLFNLIPNQKYYYRVKLDDISAYWSKAKSFTQKISDHTIFISDTKDEPELFTYQNTSYDTVSKSWKLSSEKISLKILSGGGHDGAFGSIQWNGLEQLPNTYYWGLATAIIDTVTLRPISIRYFNVPDPGVSDSLTRFVNNLAPSTVIAMTISADAAQNVLGYTGNTPPRNAIKTLGSLYIDSIRYREGWCILGRKGAPIGSVPEDYKKLFAGVAQIEVSKNVTYDSGYVIFPEIKFAKKWDYIKIESQRPHNSNILYIPLGIRRNGEIDTLYQFQTTSDSISLTYIDAKAYPIIKLLAKLYANQQKETPEIYSIAAKYETVPELAVNYQTIWIDKDTISQGEAVNYKAKIFNVGKSSADTFRVQLELIKPDNSSYVLIDTVINRIDPYSSIAVPYHYINKIYDGYGNFSFRLTVDPDNSIDEFIEMNNIFYKSFYVKKDTTTSVSAAAVSVLFNGREIRDWEYVEPDARIEIKINYPIWFPVSDTSAVQVYLNGKRYYAEQLFYDYDTIERKINIRLETQLSKGEHNLRIYLKDAYGRIQTAPIIDKYFRVTLDMELRRVYNYPNPFKNETHFTFELTQVPDEVHIKIYTVAGRLIKEIRLNSTQLTTNFNKVYWDGRDEDGNLIGNGVYLYKVVAKKGDKTQVTTQKLAVVR